MTQVISKVASPEKKLRSKLPHLSISSSSTASSQISSKFTDEELNTPATLFFNKTQYQRLSFFFEQQGETVNRIFTNTKSTLGVMTLFIVFNGLSKNVRDIVVNSEHVFKKNILLPPTFDNILLKKYRKLCTSGEYVLKCKYCDFICYMAYTMEHMALVHDRHYGFGLKTTSSESISTSVVGKRWDIPTTSYCIFQTPQCQYRHFFRDHFTSLINYRYKQLDVLFNNENNLLTSCYQKYLKYLSNNGKLYTVDMCCHEQQIEDKKFCSCIKMSILFYQRFHNEIFELLNSIQLTNWREGRFEAIGYIRPQKLENPEGDDVSLSSKIKYQKLRKHTRKSNIFKEFEDRIVKVYFDFFIKENPNEDDDDDDNAVNITKDIAATGSNAVVNIVDDEDDDAAAADNSDQKNATITTTITAKTTTTTNDNIGNVMSNNSIIANTTDTSTTLTSSTSIATISCTTTAAAAATTADVSAAAMDTHFNASTVLNSNNLLAYNQNVHFNNSNSGNSGNNNSSNSNSIYYVILNDNNSNASYIASTPLIATVTNVKNDKIFDNNSTGATTELPLKTPLNKKNSPKYNTRSSRKRKLFETSNSAKIAATPSTTGVLQLSSSPQHVENESFEEYGLKGPLSTKNILPKKRFKRLLLAQEEKTIATTAATILTAANVIISSTPTIKTPTLAHQDQEQLDEKTIIDNANTVIVVTSSAPTTNIITNTTAATTIDTCKKQNFTLTKKDCYNNVEDGNDDKDINNDDDDDVNYENDDDNHNIDVADMNDDIDSCSTHLPSMHTNKIIDENETQYCFQAIKGKTKFKFYIIYIFFLIFFSSIRL